MEERQESLAGRTLGGFGIEEKLGQGGMGVVYRATQVSLARAVALKVLDPFLARQPGVAARFKTEARAAARLDHPNVVHPIDFGEDGGFLFFAMELMDGGSAGARLAARGRFSEKDAVEVGIAIARALEYAEAQGLVHRDVKPDNILFSKHGTPKLADLGLVLERDRDAALTEPGFSVGTAEYMAPEQARGERDLDVRTDIYALGATLFELVAGRRPYTGPDSVAIAIQHITAPVPDAREAAEVSDGFAAVLGRMMAKAREDRFASAKALREALEAVRDGTTPAAAAPDPAAAPAPWPDSSIDERRAAPSGGTAKVAVQAVRVAGAAPASVVDPAALAPRTGIPRPILPPPPPATPRRVPVVAIAAVLAVLAAGLGAVLLRREGAARIDPAAEAAGVKALRELLESRRKTDGTFGYDYGEPADPWTCSQTCVALATAREPRPTAEKLEPLLRYLRATAFPPEPGARGWPVEVAIDNAPSLEPSAWAAIAIALAGDEGGAGPWTAADRERVRGFFLASQAPDGGFPTIPVAGPAAVRTSATVLALAAVLALDARDDVRAGDTEAIERALRWLGTRYDRARHVWFTDPDKQEAWRTQIATPGVSEFVVWTILEGETLLLRRARPLPSEARTAVEDFAASFAPQELPWSALGVADSYEYVFTLPAGVRATFYGYRWVAPAARLLAAERLARAGWPPRTADWRREAARLRRRIPLVVSELERAATFQLAECLLAANLVTGRPPEDPHTGSLVQLLLERPH